MFSAFNLNAALEKHSIFQALEKCENATEDTKSRAHQLIHIHGGNLFVWEEQRSCLHTTNLRSIIDDDQAAENVQTLLCRNAPLFQVRSIMFNQSASHVALVGSRGMTVLVLPKRWGRDAEYEGGKSKITCRTFAIAERFFISNISVQLIQASWYPSASSPHLCLLTSDNVFRIYNLQSDPQMPMQTHKLNQMLDNNMSMTGSRLSLLSMYSVTSGLGETVVAFDFAPLIDYTPTVKSLLSKQRETTQLQPVYLLQGNGDVLLLFTSLTNNKFSKGMLHGPLIMLPSAEDNYGTDSCSIHVMNTAPCIIIIATATGKLHHCVSLWSQDSDDDIGPGRELDVQSIISRSLSRVDTSVIGELVPPTLYVYETVELEMDLTMPDEDAESRFITLHGDPILSCRYHCCTSVGIHSVALPWLSRMDAFVKADDENKEMLSDLTHDEPCIIEHVLCTKPTLSSLPCAIKGLTIASDPMFGPSLICLTEDNHCTAVPLLNTFRPKSPPLMSFIEEQTMGRSPNRKFSETNFEDHVRSILKRDASQPIIRAADWISAPSDRECFQLITRATQVLRDEYILKQKLAGDAITKRVQLLNEQKQQQQEELQDLNGIKSKLTSTAEQIASDYEDCKERQQLLMERLDSVVKRVKVTDPVLSKAESDMAKELRTLQEKLRQADNNIKQLRVKQEYQANKQEKQDESDRGAFFKSSDPSRRSLQTDKYKQIILEEGEKISELIKKLNNMNLQVGL